MYLTSAYAPYFAMNCVEVGEDMALLIEVDTGSLDTGSMLPDEDFITQAIVKVNNETIPDIHMSVRDTLENWSEFAADSVRLMGNIAYRGVVPASAITRYCLFDPKEQAALAWAACDPTISLLNYRFCGEKYRQMIAWLFGDRSDWQIGHGDNEQFFAMMDKMQPGYSEGCRQQFQNRSGINVIEVGERHASV